MVHVVDGDRKVIVSIVAVIEGRGDFERWSAEQRF